jgi:hypothetical protein
MATKTLPPRELLRELLNYDVVTGQFTWRHRPREMFGNANAFSAWNARYARKVAGSVKPDGRVDISIGHKLFKTHRLVWLYIHGDPVPACIDHIDGDKLNNRIHNLRAATKSENGANMRIRSSNTTGVKGVGLLPNGRYRARVMLDRKEHYLGRFSSLEEAAKAQFDAAVRLHGIFARWG